MRAQPRIFERYPDVSEDEDALLQALKVNKLWRQGHAASASGDPDLSAVAFLRKSS